MSEQTAKHVWNKIFDKIKDGTEGTPEDINEIMRLVDKYGSLKE